MPPSLALCRMKFCNLGLGGGFRLPAPLAGVPPGMVSPSRVGSPGGLADSRPGTFSTVLNPGES